jgi:putative Holliday junction resolvase
MATPGQVLGFDFGLKSIGVAIGHTLTASARGIGVVAVRKGLVDWEVIDRHIAEWGPDACVVGLSLHMDGAFQSFHPQLVHFKKSLESRYAIPVYWQDERLTTVEAKAQLFEAGGAKKLTKARIDAKSAEIILKQWLDRGEYEE